MRYRKSHAIHRLTVHIKASPSFVGHSAVMVFAVVAAYPCTAGTPRPATTTPAISGSGVGALSTANSLNRAEATAPLRGSAQARIRLSSSYRPKEVAAPLCAGSPASLPRLQRRNTGAPSAVLPSGR
ncbi:MAG: hypothetical protein PHI06_02800 [Desulfobulbaceae bacterium]|nr:hypothetical protein [Desulfobulbaceae bacterium]